MKTSRPILAVLYPNFLARADRYLLLNNPRFWATRFHYVLYYGLLATVLLNLLVYVFIRPSDLGLVSNVIIWVILLSQVAGYLFWLHKQSLFSVEKEYGNTQFAVAFVEVLVYLACILAIFMGSFSTLITASYAAAQKAGLYAQVDCARAMKKFQPDRYMFTQDPYWIDTRGSETRVHFDNDWLQCCHVRMFTAGPFPNFNYPSGPIRFNGSSFEPYWIGSCLDDTPGGSSFKESVFLNRRGPIEVLSDARAPSYMGTVAAYVSIALLGVILAFAAQYSAWRDFAFIGLYALISLGLFLLLLLILDPLLPDYFFDEVVPGIDQWEAPGVIFCALITVFILFYSVRFTLAKKRSYFALLNFISLPIAIGVFVLVVAGDLSDGDGLAVARALAPLVPVYVLLAPLLKRVFMRSLALPEG